MSDTGALTGGTAELWVNGVELGCVVDVNFREAIQLVRVDVLGKKQSLEILEDGSTCSMQASSVWMDETEWRNVRVVQNGERTSAQLPAAVAIIRDNASSKVVGKMEGLMLEGRGLSVSRGRALMTDVTMQGIKMSLGSEFG